MPVTDRCSPADAGLLHVETFDTPVHTGSVAILDGAPLREPDGQLRSDELRAYVERRLHLVPRLRQRLAIVPMAQGRPEWIDDPDFDITYHVRYAALPAPGRPDQLHALVARVMAQPLDRSRPLWELCFVEGLEGGRVGVIEKIHPAIVDGVHALHRWSLLYDDAPSTVQAVAPSWIPMQVPTPMELVGRAWGDRVSEPAEGLRVVGAVLRGSRRRAGRVLGMARSVASLASRPAPGPRPALRRLGGRTRKVATASIVLAPVQHAHRILGATVHEVVVTAVLGGVERVLTVRGEATANRVLRTLLPVSVSAPGGSAGPESSELSTTVHALFADLPLDLDDPLARLRAVQEATGRLRAGESTGSGRIAAGARELLDVGEWGAPTLFDLAVRMAMRASSSAPLLVVDVPGPQHPLWCHGAKLLHWYPILPLAPETALSVGVLSYDGRLSIGFNADAATLPDLGPLVAGVLAEFAALVRAASGRRRGRRP